MNRSELFETINANIDQYGYHKTCVIGGGLPRFVYTIGCKTILGAEIVFAGGELYSLAAIGEIIDEIISTAKQGTTWHELDVSIDSLGQFSLIKSDKSWSELLALGAIDYYNETDIPTWQILPDANHRTLDVPDMTNVFDAASQPVWQWLSRTWEHPVPANSMAVTDLQMLFGAKATEIMRWETDEWEIFSGVGPDIPKEDRRIVPLAVLLGIDQSLMPAVQLAVGKGLWRDELNLEWHNWE